MLNDVASDIVYPLFILISVIIPLLLLYLYLRKRGYQKKALDDILFSMALSCLAGLIGAVLFQNLYDFIENPQSYTFSFGLTFLGGLVSGVICFLLLYRFRLGKKYPHSLEEIMTACGTGIPLGHSVGRLGCFLNGCCYGKPVTDGGFLSFTGIRFITTPVRVYPTNLFECLFLLLVGGLLLYPVFKKDFRLSFPLYGLSYGLFRFFLEYLRDDPRGAFIPGLSPSQFWCLVLFALSFFDLLSVILRKNVFLPPRKKNPSSGNGKESI